ncbi:endospore germination permease [Paenibacillus sp. M1]|uniref:Endospore germination permease n=1 Tax=Paenibacillus haidiansis TaxID=1574488 RepID=A0ABU7VUX7_9BACL
MEKAAIPLHQVFWMFVCSRFILNLVSNPFFNELANDRDIIPALIIGVPVQLIYAVPFLLLWLKYPERSLIEYSSSILGRFLGKIVGLLYIGYFLMQTAITVRFFDDFLVTRFFYHTPMEAIGLGLLVIVVYAVYMGVEVIGRCASVLVPVIFFGMLLLVALAFSQAHGYNVAPTWETSPGEFMITMLPTATRWSELAWTAVLFPLIRKRQNIKPAVFGGIIFVNFLFFIVNVSVVAIFGPVSVKNIRFPTLEMVQSVSVGEFLDRVESLVLGLWVFGAFVKTAIFFYVCVQCVTEWFKLKDRKPLIIPMGIIVYLLSILLFSNIVELSIFSGTVIPIDFAFTFLLPLLMLLIYFVKKPFQKRSS